MEHDMTISELMRGGTLKVASLPPENWRYVDDDSPVTMPLIAENYPAKTAQMWNAACAKFGMPDHNCMVVADPTQVGLIIQTFRNDPRYRGGGAGIGFKEAVIPYLDELTPLAKAMGAVNIIRKLPNGKLEGDNTDGLGFARSLSEMFGAQRQSLKGAKVLMLGAGGSGRAIAFALAQQGALLTILNRTVSKAEELADAINAYTGREVAVGGGRLLIPTVLQRQDAVVSVVDDANSPLDEYSPLGDMLLPVTPDSIEKNRKQTDELLSQAKQTLIVSDIRIRKTETPMLAEAREHGMKVLNGIPMVVFQGVLAFWWLYQDELKKHGHTLADVEDVMWSAVKL
jgi:shikimate dehydrogenase